MALVTSQFGLTVQLLSNTNSSRLIFYGFHKYWRKPSFMGIVPLLSMSVYNNLTSTIALFSFLIIYASWGWTFLKILKGFHLKFKKAGNLVHLPTIWDWCSTFPWETHGIYHQIFCNIIQSKLSHLVESGVYIEEFNQHYRLLWLFWGGGGG